MRYAIISDIHANEAALRAVLTDAADARAEKVVCLGDVLGYGPDPVAALELVYRRVHVCLAGNHDDAVSRRFPLTDFTPFAAAAVERHRAALTREAIDWLRRLPHVCEFPAIYDGADGAFACAHGDFADPKNFNYVLEPADAVPSWCERTEQLLFVGHSHKPGIFVLGSSGTPHALEPADFVLEPGKRYLVNVGSVGYPRNGVCRSFYCIYDDCSRAVFFRSLPFDLEEYRRKMNGQGLDEAPWMVKRAKERKGGVVRGEAHFGKEADSASAAKVIVLKPLVKKVESAKGAAMRKNKNVPPPEAPRPALTTAKLRAPIALQPEVPLVEPKVKPPNGNLIPALIVCGLVVAFAGIWCTYTLVRTIVERRGTASAVEVKSAPVEKALLPDERFSHLQRLPEEWTATFERPQQQRVDIEANLRRAATAFRLTSNGPGTIRISKTISLVEKPPKLYWTVALLSTSAPGQAMAFSFNVRISFYDERGDFIGESLGSGKRSATNKSAPVPSGAVRAIMEVDCLCEGTYDLAIPYLKTSPDERRMR